MVEQRFGQDSIKSWQGFGFGFGDVIYEFVSESPVGIRGKTIRKNIRRLKYHIKYVKNLYTDILFTFK